MEYYKCLEIDINGLYDTTIYFDKIVYKGNGFIDIFFNKCLIAYTSLNGVKLRHRKTTGDTELRVAHFILVKEEE